MSPIKNNGDHNYSCVPFCHPNIVEEKHIFEMDYATGEFHRVGIIGRMVHPRAESKELETTKRATFDLSTMIVEAKELGGNFRTVAKNMESHPEYGFWIGFAFAAPDLKCRFCGHLVPFREAKRWQNLAQHLARQHADELPNGNGLQPVDLAKWKKAKRQ